VSFEMHTGAHTNAIEPEHAEAAALHWLYSLADQERGVGWNPRASPDAQWKLGRTRALLDLVGAPDRRLRLALVAGTKGKGSTSAMLASILGAAGVRCGLYTKPHLQTYRERIRIDGTAISPHAFSKAVERMRSCVASLPRDAGEPTTFEVTTALAVDQFARDRCEMAILEVGLGGRLDATNATEPFVSVITSISYDHTAILGRTLGAIALEKAGILRAGRRALLAPQRPAAARALARACRDVGADCREIPPLEGELARCLPLAGAHQRQNAALAIGAARAMADCVTDAGIAHGLSRLRWPGRFEVVADREPTIVLDGAHNGASAEALATTLAEFAGGRPISLVIGINRDKDARAVLRPLLRIVNRVWATRARDNPRALDAAVLGQLCRRLGATVDVQADLQQALADAKRESGIVCVTGSLMLVGQARASLGLPPPERLW
jgi:dihydrofolate synthase / folylpolyglutamate synthase